MTAPSPVPAAPAGTLPKQKNPVGLAALIVGAVALLTAIIPVLSFITWLPAIAAIVLGIVGAVLKNRQRRFAWIGLGLGVVAWIVAIIVSFATIAGAADAVSEAIESASAAPVVPAEPVEESAAAEPSEPAAEEPAQPEVPTEWASALTQAATYSEIANLSKAGIYDQLVSEYGGKFTPEAAQYAVDNLDADYNANALETAKTFQEMALSPAAIYDQLTSEFGSKFTPEEAQYAVDNLG